MVHGHWVKISAPCAEGCAGNEDQLRILRTAKNCDVDASVDQHERAGAMRYFATHRMTDNISGFGYAIPATGIWRLERLDT
jgi:hypothetical protein